MCKAGQTWGGEGARKPDPGVSNTHAQTHGCGKGSTHALGLAATTTTQPTRSALLLQCFYTLAAQRRTTLCRCRRGTYTPDTPQIHPRYTPSKHLTINVSHHNKQLINQKAGWQPIVSFCRVTGTSWGAGLYNYCHNTTRPEPPCANNPAEDAAAHDTAFNTRHGKRHGLQHTRFATPETPIVCTALPSDANCTAP